MGEFFQALWNAILEWANTPEMQDALASLAGGALLIVVILMILDERK